MESYVGFVGSQCGVHFGWYTHTNVAGCWICDAITALSAVLRELRKYSTLEESDIAAREIDSPEEPEATLGDEHINT